MSYIEKLKANLPEPVDLDRLYCDYLSRSLGDDYKMPPMVEHLQWGEVIKEMSPTDFNCGQADWSDMMCRDGSLEYFEGEHYDHNKFVSAVEGTIEDIEADIEDQKSYDADADVAALDDEIINLQRLI